MASNERATVIYGLVDPRTGHLRYVGKTCRTMSARLVAHRTTARTGRSTVSSGVWLRELMDQGFQPDAFVLEIVPAGGDWVAAERYWIASMKLAGAILTNHSCGGEGIGGFRHTAATKAKISEKHRGKIISFAQRQAMSERLRGVPRGPYSADRCQRMAEAKRGIPSPWARTPHSEEHRQKQSEAARRKPPMTDDQRKKLSEAAKRRFMNPLERLKRSDALKGARRHPNGRLMENFNGR